MYVLIIFDEIGFIDIKFGSCKKINNYIEFIPNEDNQNYYIISKNYLGLFKISKSLLSIYDMDITNNICTETLHNTIMSNLCTSPINIELINEDFNNGNKYYGCFNRNIT